MSRAALEKRIASLESRHAIRARPLSKHDMAIRIFTILAYDGDSPHCKRIADVLSRARQRMEEEEYF
jgi:hypothetical protein